MERITSACRAATTLDHPRADLLKHNGLWVGMDEGTGIPLAIVTAPAWVDAAFDVCVQIAPVHIAAPWQAPVLGRGDPARATPGVTTLNHLTLSDPSRMPTLT